MDRSTTKAGGVDAAFSIGVSPSASVVDALSIGVSPSASHFSPLISTGYRGRGPLIFWGSISMTDTDGPDEEEACVSTCLGQGRTGADRLGAEGGGA